MDRIYALDQKQEKQYIHLISCVVLNNISEKYKSLLHIITTIWVSKTKNFRLSQLFVLQ